MQLKDILALINFDLQEQADKASFKVFDKISKTFVKSKNGYIFHSKEEVVSSLNMYISSTIFNKWNGCLRLFNEDIKTSNWSVIYNSIKKYEEIIITVYNNNLTFLQHFDAIESLVKKNY